MASISKRKNKNGTSHWRAVIRIKGYPTVCEHFDRKQEAEDWAADTERQIRLGKHKFKKEDQNNTLSDLIDRFIEDGALDYHKAAKDTRLHLEYFKKSLGGYALVYLTPDLLLAERKKLLNSPSARGSKRNPATVNRYFSALSGVLRYGCRNLRWTDDNPCANLLKLKEAPRERRILTEDEEVRLLEACRQSKNPYLYCITLFALTTGARRGEILGSTWDCIDFANRIAFIKDSKNGRPRKVGLVSSVVEELKRLYSNRNLSKNLVFASKTAFARLTLKRHGKMPLRKRELGISYFMAFAITFVLSVANSALLGYSYDPSSDIHF